MRVTNTIRSPPETKKEGDKRKGQNDQADKGRVRTTGHSATLGLTREERQRLERGDDDGGRHSARAIKYQLNVAARRMRSAVLGACSGSPAGESGPNSDGFQAASRCEVA